MIDINKNSPRLHSILNLALFAAIAIYPIAFVPTAVGSEAPTIEQFSQVSGMTPPPGTRLEPTVVEGIYAFRFPNNTKDQCAQYVSADLRLIANNGQKSWSHLRGGSRLSGAEEARIGRHIVDAISDQSIIVGSRGSNPAFTLISAIDCPYCRSLESELQRRGISYRVVPGALSSAHEAAAETAWRAVDPGGAWFAMLSGRNENFPRGPNRGEYPRRAFRDVRCMTGGTTSTAIFPDGRAVVGQQGILSRL